MNSMTTLVTLLLFCVLLDDVMSSRLLRSLTGNSRKHSRSKRQDKEENLNDNNNDNDNENDNENENDDSCGVCLSNKPDKKIGRCNHKFCSSCIDILKKKKTYRCPICRNSYTSDDPNATSGEEEVTHTYTPSNEEPLGPNDNINEDLPSDYPSRASMPHEPMLVPHYNPSDPYNNGQSRYRIVFVNEPRQSNPVLNNLASIGRGVIDYVNSYLQPGEDPNHGLSESDKKEALIRELEKMQLEPDEIEMILRDYKENDHVSSNYDADISDQVCAGCGNPATHNVSMNCNHKLCGDCVMNARINLTHCTECGSEIMN